MEIEDINNTESTRLDSYVENELDTYNKAKTIINFSFFGSKRNLYA